MDGWKDDGASLAWLSVTHTQFIRFHSSLWLSHVTPIQPAPNDLFPHSHRLQPARETISIPIPIPVPYLPFVARSLSHSLTPHSHLTRNLTHTPTPYSPYPLSPIPPSPTTQLIALASAPFPSPTILPPFHFTTASNHLHSSPRCPPVPRVYSPPLAAAPPPSVSCLTDLITRSFLSVVINYER